MFWPAIGVVTEEIARNFAVAATFDQQLPKAEDIAIHDTGDFSAFAIAWFLENTVFSRIQNTPLRRGLSVGLTAAGVIGGETLPLIGRPDIAQIPAGIIGLLLYTGLTAYFEHKANQATRRNNNNLQ